MSLLSRILKPKTCAIRHADITSTCIVVEVLFLDKTHIFAIEEN